MDSTIFAIDDIRKIVRQIGLNRIMDDAIAALTAACREFDPRSSAVPVRDGFDYSEPQVGLIEWMPSMKSGKDVCIKVVGYHPANPELRGIPTILSTAMTFDTCTGHLLTILDATFLTALRTGAASAVASRILASPGSKILGLIGAGAQAISQLHALSRVFEFEQVMVFDSDPATSASFAARAAQLNLGDIKIDVRSLEELVKHADIICTATSVEIGAGPVFADSGLKSAVHINAVGSDFPGKIEVPHSILQRGLVCPDFLCQALREGECQQLRSDEIGPDLVELVKRDGGYSDYRHRCTVFDSTGWALEDYIVVELLADYGRQLGLGKRVELMATPVDPKNPYEFLADSAIDLDSSISVQAGKRAINDA